MIMGSSLRSTLIGSNSVFSGINQTTVSSCVSGRVKTVEIGRFENRVFGVDGAAEVLRGLVIEG